MRDADLVETRPGAEPPARDAVAGAPQRYRMLEQLGEGGMGVVWAAHDSVLDRTVALKLLHDRFLGAAEQERLAGEARAMARLSHPNVVAVYDVGEHEGRMFLTMELVRGIHLARWLEKARGWREIVGVFRAAGRGLAAAHAAGIIHRDVKPSNILVGEHGDVRVADFGVAHASVARPDPGAPLTALTAGAIGTLEYMSPEQLRGEPSDVRCDEFAFCASLYEALHGKRPFDGETVESRLAAIERGCPPPIKAVPRWLHEALARGLAFAPGARFPTMTALLAALDGPRRRRRWVVAAALALVAGGTAAAFALVHRGDRCDARDALAGVWNDDARARGKAAFAQLELSYASEAWNWLSRELDADLEHWAASTGDACRDHDAAREACLEEHRAMLAALVARAAKPDAALAGDPAGALASIPPVTDCGDHAYQRVRALLAEAQQADEQQDATTVSARTIEALRIADAAHIDDARLLPLLFLYTRAALEEGRLPDALTGSKRAVDTARALGQHHPLYGRAEALAGAYQLKAGKLDKARNKANSALRVAVEAYGESHVDAADAHALLGAIDAAQGQTRQALVELRAALDVRARLAPQSRELQDLRRAIEALEPPSP